MPREQKPFWQTKRPEEMTSSEWESLCDGCGKCCLNKLEDATTKRVFYTKLACKLLDHKSCRCSDYKNRFDYVPDCIKLEPNNVHEICLPKSCAYRLVAEGKPLAWWHPLVSGDPETVHQAGMSARGRVICETTVDDDDWDASIVRWPDRIRATISRDSASKNHSGKTRRKKVKAAKDKPVRTIPAKRLREAT